MPAPSSSFGYLPDPLDERDWKYSDVLKAQPLAMANSIDLRPQVVEILNQGLLGSCVAHGVLGAIRLKNVIDGVKNPKLGNRLHVYAGARSYIGTLDWDSGSHIRDAFRFISAVGFMPEEDTDNKYDTSKFAELPNPREMKWMFDQRNKLQGQVSYYRITERGEDRKQAIQQALSRNNIPVLGTQTTQQFLSYTDGILRRPLPSQRQTGGHAFYLCGYTDEYVIISNSWDDDWGLNGFALLGWDYILWLETRDIWVVEKAPYFSHLVAA